MNAINTSNNNNSSYSIDFPTLQQMSLDLLHQQLKYKVVQVFTGSTNMIFCCATLLVFFKFPKNYQSSTFYFLRLLFINDLIETAYNVILAIWHVANAIFGIPEVYHVFTCFLINQLTWLCLLIDCMCTFQIAFDRLMIMFFQSTQKNFKCICIGSIILSLILHIICFFDQYDLEPVIYCGARLSLGKRFSVVICLLIPAFVSWLSFFLYCTMLVLATYKYRKLINNNNALHDSVETVQLKRNKKLTMVLSYTAILCFFIGPFASTLYALFQQILPDYLFNLSSWLALLSSVPGMLYTVSLLFVQDFRQDLHKILSKTFHCCFVQNLNHAPGHESHGMQQVHPAANLNAVSSNVSNRNPGMMVSTSHM